MRQSLATSLVSVLTLLTAVAWVGATQAMAQYVSAPNAASGPTAPSTYGYATPAPTSPPTTSYGSAGAPLWVSPAPSVVASPPLGATGAAPSAPTYFQPGGYPISTPPPPAGSTPYVSPGSPGVVPPKPPLKPLPPDPAASPKSPLGTLGGLAVELGLHLLSGNEVPVLSGNKVKVEDSNPASILSGNKSEIHKSAGGDLLNPSFSFMSGNKVEIRIVNSANGSGNNNRDSGNSATPGGRDSTSAESCPAVGNSSGRQTTLPADVLLGRPCEPAAPPCECSPALKPTQTTALFHAVSALLLPNSAPAPARPLSPEAAARVEQFKRLDLNGDGVITLDEYLRATAE